MCAATWCKDSIDPEVTCPVVSLCSLYVGRLAVLHCSESLISIAFLLRYPSVHHSPLCYFGCWEARRSHLRLGDLLPSLLNRSLKCWAALMPPLPDLSWGLEVGVEGSQVRGSHCVRSVVIDQLLNGIRLKQGRPTSCSLCRSVSKTRGHSMLSIVKLRGHKCGNTMHTYR